MTTIAAAAVDGVHALASDGRAVAGSLIVADDVEKVVGMLGGIGVVAATAGDLRTVDLMRGLELESRTPEAFARQLKALYEAENYLPQDGGDHAGTAPCWTQEHFFMTEAGVWWISQDMSVAPLRENLPAAIGTGSELAIGAMESLLSVQSDVTAAALVLHAVRVAMKRDAGTGGGIQLALRGAETFGPEWI